MTRILPGSLVRHADGWTGAVLSTVRNGDVLRANLWRDGARIADVPAEQLTVVRPPPATPKLRLEGLPR